MGKSHVALTALLVGICAGPATADVPAWPSTTRSVTTLDEIKVYDAAKGDKIGKIAEGRRVAFGRIVATKDRCKSWIEIRPRGWVCGKDVAPSDEAPHTDAIAEPEGTRFADVRGDNVNAYRSKAAIKKGIVKQIVSGQTFVAVYPTSVKVGRTTYHKTDKGFIAEKSLRWLEPSEFEGIDLTTSAAPGWPFAWASPEKKNGTVAVRAAPKRKAKKLRELTRRELVPVLETKKKWARIGDGEWVKLSELRVARAADAPDGVGDDERWIDVDLDQQVLVAYEGKTPVFATLVSTGKKKFPTPTGTYRIARKYTKTRMRNPKHITVDTWDVAEVPFAMKFRKNFALHGAYWHDGFGKPRSHGCVNLSPRDARRMFDWVSPEVTPGWTEVELDDVEEVTGTVIRVRNRSHPDPKWKPYDGDARKVASR